jgi:ribosome biogenesis GTPase
VLYTTAQYGNASRTLAPEAVSVPLDRLRALGWDEALAAAFEPYAARGLRPARVTLEHQHIYRVADDEGEYLARVRGRMRHQAEAREAFPAVGDWVAIKRQSDRVLRDGGVRDGSLPDRGLSDGGVPDGEAAIEAVLPRRSRFSRKVAGNLTEEQVVAANIDIVFLVSGLDHDFNLRRIERYITTTMDGGATPVILLNKADLVEDVEAMVREAEAVAAGAPVHAISTKTGVGLDAFDRYLRPGVTAAFLGSSGVGKSSLINRLLGQTRQRVNDVREKDSRGRHTTTNRELIVTPGGGIIIDTPGMREMQLWDGTVADAFSDIDAIAADCHFRDCQHEQEPRCAVRAAVEDGRLTAARLASFHQIQKELAHQVVRQDQQARIAEKRRSRAGALRLREHYERHAKPRA